MSNVAIVYHSGFGHTQALADAIAKGIQRVPGAKATLIPVDQAEAQAGELDAADAIVFGSPTYMGGISAEFARFKDWTSKRWMTRAWQNKLASGFTVSASWGGDKHGTLHQLLTLAAQHGMVWVGLGEMVEGTAPDKVNRLSAFSGVMAQTDWGQDQTNEGDRKSATILGKRVAQAAARWGMGG